MDCQCNENKGVTVPYAVFEGEMARQERHIKRLWIVVIALIAALLATNIGWLVFESQFETIYWEQEGDGLNNMNTGEQGDVNFEPKREVQEEEKREAKGDAYVEQEP